MKPILSLALMSIISLPASADELRILTSFPAEMTDVFAGVWEKDKSTTTLRILNKNTVSALEEIQRGNVRGFDLFWASSPEAFVMMEREGHFVDPTVCGPNGPASIEEFALSAVGWARRSESTLFMPGEWNDLLLPIYRDQIAMTRPARSGTTHLLVEQLLQVRGWEDGWAYLLELSGNLSTLTARSYGVPDGLLNDRFEIGLTIDFLATSNGENLQFRYGRPMMIFAARIGILNGGNNLEQACKFVHMLLSDDGQRALVDPRVSRIPIDADVRAAVRTAIPTDIATSLLLPWLSYDPVISADRYWAVNALFDLMITDTLIERRALWRRYTALESKADPLELAHVRTLLTAMPIAEQQAVEVSGQSETGLRPSAASAFERDILATWQRSVSGLLDDARRALEAMEEDLAE